MNLKNKLLNILKSFAMIFLVLCFSVIFFAVFNIDPRNISDSKYIMYLTISNITLMGIFIFIYHKTLIKDFKNFINSFDSTMETSIKYWIIGFTVMVISNLIITFILKKDIAGNEQNVRSYIDAFPIFMIFNTVFYAPLTEELTFRKSIKDAISNKWFYVITSGLVFGMLHISSYITSWTDLVYLIPYGSLGISFAMLYYKTDNIYSTMTMHAIHNAIAICAYLLGAML